MKLEQKSETTNAAWMERWTRASFQNYAPAPVAFARGRGAKLWDVEGKEYLDFAAGVAVCSTGHAHPKVVEAIARQANELLHTSNLYLVPNQIQLAEELLALSGLGRAFFCNSGAEAVEAAMKLARYWGHANGARTDFITTGHGFHGRTLGALTLTRNPKYQQGFEPLLPGVHEVPYDDVDAVQKAITSQTCAVVVEPVQGEGGVNVPHDGYLRGLREVCDDAGVLLVLDEVQTGIGRTGHWFSFQETGVRPDILVLAKGLGSGFPIGAMLATEDLNILKPGTHESTFGGSPLACAAGLATLNVLRKEKVLANVQRQGTLLLRRLKEMAGGGAVERVRGKGLLVGFDLTAGSSKEFALRLLTAGLLVSHIGERTIRLAPPLIVGEQEVQRALGLISQASGG